MSRPRPAARGGVLLRLLPLAACAVLAALELWWARRAHRTTEELHVMAFEGSPRERVWALHVLANRGDAPQRELPEAYVRALIRDPDPLVADLAYTVDVCRLCKPVWQERRLKARLEEPEEARDDLEDWWRRYALYRRKVGGKPLGAALRLKNEEARWLLHVLAGGSLDEEALVPYVEDRLGESNQARIHRLSPPKPRNRDWDD